MGSRFRDDESSRISFCYMLGTQTSKSLLNPFQLSYWRGDVFGGVTTAIVSLPLALAFGVASGVGPTAGLYGAVCVGLFAALFGGTPTLISEPTGPMTVVMTTIVAQMLSLDPDQGLGMAFTVVMLAGILQVIFGFFKLGKYITLMPYSVISGFMSGIGVILIILQIGPLLGQPTPRGGVIGTLQALPMLISNARWPELALGLITIALIMVWPKPWRRYLPPQLVALVVGTLLSLTVFGDGELRRIGEIPTGLPVLQVPVFEPQHWRVIMIDAFLLGILGCIDTLLTSVIADSLTRTEHDSDKELIGQGIGNFISGLCGGLPGAGATMGTVVNIQTGGKTHLAGVTRALILLIIVLGAAQLTQPIPMAVLAGIAFKVGLDILDWSFLKRAHSVSLRGSLIMYGVLFLTVFVDLIVAVGVGVFVADILTIERLSQVQAKSIKLITDTDDDVRLSPEEKQLLDLGKGRILLFYLSGPMIFGLSKAIAREHNAMKVTDVLVMDLTDVPMMGVTASLAIENAIRDAVDKGAQVFLVGASEKLQQRLERLGIFHIVPRNNLFTSRLQALQTAVQQLQQKGMITLA